MKKIFLKKKEKKGEKGKRHVAFVCQGQAWCQTNCLSKCKNICLQHVCNKLEQKAKQVDSEGARLKNYNSPPHTFSYFESFLNKY